MASTEGVSVTRSEQYVASGLWALSPYPAIVADAAGTVVEVNPAAALLLKGAAPGASMLDAVPNWLARAHRETVAHGWRPARNGCHAGDLPSVSGRIAAHSYEAHPTRREDGSVVWWLVDDTDRRLAEEALATERERTRFLAEASNVLLASLNTDRCMTATARLAAEYLADVAVVVAPASGGKLPLALGIAGQDVTHALVAADPSQLPGLSEALQGFPPVPSRWIDPANLPDWTVPPDYSETIRSVVVTPYPATACPPEP